MSKRSIGIELGKRTLRIAILNHVKGTVAVDALEEREFGDREELVAQIRAVLAGDFAFGDRVASCLPAHAAYVRRLDFPFSEERKVAAAMPLELSSQLPVSIEGWITEMQKAQPIKEGVSVVAAALPPGPLEDVIDAFEKAGVPLHLVDLAPFGYLAGLERELGDGLLVCSTEQETTVAIISNGRIQDYRILPTEADPSSQPEWIRQVQRELRMLEHASGVEDLPARLIGSINISILLENLRSSGQKAELLSITFGGKTVDTRYLPAVATALRAGKTRPEGSFNFRRGPYALRGEWANLKKKFGLLITLLGLLIAITGVSMLLKYTDKKHRAESLQTEMVSIYRTLFPEAVTIVDVPLQMKSAIRDLQGKTTLLSGGQVTVLAILTELSLLPDLATMEIEEFSLASSEIKLNGWTTSFEAVNQMADRLSGTELFTDVQISNAKMSLDGRQVDFRLLLSLSGQGAGE